MWGKRLHANAVSPQLGEAQLYLRSPGVLSAAELEWIFRRTAKTVLRWPQSPVSGRFRVVPADATAAPLFSRAKGP
jgi:hypothetical protein